MNVSYIQCIGVCLCERVSQLFYFISSGATKYCFIWWKINRLKKTTSIKLCAVNFTLWFCTRSGKWEYVNPKFSGSAFVSAQRNFSSCISSQIMLMSKFKIWQWFLSSLYSRNSEMKYFLMMVADWRMQSIGFISIFIKINSISNRINKRKWFLLNCWTLKKNTWMIDYHEYHTYVRYPCILCYRLLAV